MDKNFKLKLVGNHWYPCIKHDLENMIGFNRKIDKFLSCIDSSKEEELTVELEEIGSIMEGINIVYFHESDIYRYLTTQDNFDLRFVINNREFSINSDLYWLLEYHFNFNFHKESYKIHIY